MIKLSPLKGGEGMIIERAFRVLLALVVLTFALVSLYGQNDLTLEIFSHRVTEEVGSPFFKVTAKEPDKQKLVVVGVKITHRPETKEILTNDLAVTYSAGGKNVTAPCFGGAAKGTADKEGFWILNDAEKSSSYSFSLNDPAEGAQYFHFVFPLPNEVNDIKLVYRGIPIGKPIHIVRK